MAELAPSVSPSSQQTQQQVYSPLRKYTLLVLFCVSQFLDAFNVSALFSAIPIMTEQLKLNQSDAVWLISAYQLCFAALLLSSGRISDIFNPKIVFVGGAFALGVFSLAAGFVHDKIGLFILRAFSGVAAAMTIPSSLTLLVRLFPGEKEQARAIGVYGGSAALGNVLGLMIGALLIQYASWPWLFWLAAIVVIPIAIAALMLVPEQPKSNIGSQREKIASLDLPGIAILTVSLILLIFAFTSTGVNSWSSATVLAPLFIAVFGIVAFFVWEARIPADRAAFPPRTWRYDNFAVLFGVALSVFLWFVAVFYLIVTLWQEVYLWKPINAAVHFLPIGLVAGPIMLFGGPLTERFDKKWVLLVSLVLVIISTLILPFADKPDKYWSMLFPAFIIGAVGASTMFVNANIAIFQNTPSHLAGTVGAIFNSALQLGSAVGVAIITSIQGAVDKKNVGKVGANVYAGRAVGFWFLLGIVIAETIAVGLFYRTRASLDKRTNGDEEKGSDDATLADTEEKAKISPSELTPAISRIHSKLEAEAAGASDEVISGQSTRAVSPEPVVAPRIEDATATPVSEQH